MEGGGELVAGVEEVAGVGGKTDGVAEVLGLPAGGEDLLQDPALHIVGNSELVKWHDQEQRSTAVEMAGVCRRLNWDMGEVIT